MKFDSTHTFLADPHSHMASEAGAEITSMEDTICNLMILTGPFLPFLPGGAW